jgi:diaminopimelate decarboxylase
MMARGAGFGPKDIMYTANYPSDEDMGNALAEGVMITLDDGSLLGRLLENGTPDILSFRLNPGVGKGKYKGIITGGEGSKFGMPIEQTIEAYKRARELGVREFGLHLMAGSCVLDRGYFPALASRVTQMAGRISRKADVDFSFIDLGGGFGIPYEPGEEGLDIAYAGKETAGAFLDGCRDHGLGRPRLMIEPGRYIIGDAGVLAGQVCGIKRTDRTFIGTDAGMNALIRPAIYGAYHEAVLASRMEDPVEKATLTGQICENTDKMALDRLLPEARVGDIVAYLDAGAYGFAMSSNYNHTMRPAEALVEGHDAKLIRRRETFGQLIQNDADV